MSKAYDPSRIQVITFNSSGGIVVQTTFPLNKREEAERYRDELNAGGFRYKIADEWDFKSPNGGE